MKIKRKKIAYISGTRADFGIMKSILKSIDRSPKLELQLYVTGIHLTSGFGSTFREVQKEFSQTRSIKVTFDSDDFGGVAKFLGKFSTKLVEAFTQNRPDFVLVLGDRPEELCVATVCLYLGIPTGHFRGGEMTSTFDEIARHANTKLCSLHFAATPESAQRIEKMGEEKWRIHTVGDASLDIILNEKLPSQEELFGLLKLDTKKRVILVTQHSVSYEMEDAGRQMGETLEAVKKFNLPVVIIYPNADAGGRRIIGEIEKERKNPLFRIFPSLEYKYFLALEREAAVWVGNSSGAMVESSSFGTPVINIGTRQMGRQRGANVIDVGYNKKEIERAIDKSLNNSAYLKRLKKIKNPWGDGKTGPRVAKILENIIISPRLLTKQITY
ncbi:MAG: UDP-N-acetylglucosamine 2-epimerase [bacterium]|nr:UDP-N-acetylglucosamine 2-epimerase [bacterium]